MDKHTYYNIREDIGIISQISQFISNLDDIMEVYWQSKNMTLQDMKQWLMDRQVEFESKIQKEMNVQ